jgi:hypothetical protein
VLTQPQIASDMDNGTRQRIMAGLFADGLL